MDLFNFVKDHLDIITVITEYTNLKKTGSQYWKALCPFHHEKTPSFSVSPHKKIFYCFGCHQTGDVINFIEKVENITAIQAVQYLVQRYNLDVPDSIEKNSPQVKYEKTTQHLCHLVAQWCNSQLLKNKAAVEYLKGRQISPATIAQFTIGYFPDGSKMMQDLLSYIFNNGFSSQELLQEHIIFQGKLGFYSPFENRIIFPIKDHLGQVCGFGGRVFLPQDQRPKYYNSKESSIFKKGKTLFGFDVAKHEIQKQKSVFIVEGYTDCVAMYQHGYSNTVATLGTACTLDHLKGLAKHAQTVFMLYDADKAGKQAILRLTQSCWQLDMELKVVVLPANEDPASLLEKGQSLNAYITQSCDIFTFFVQSMGQEFQSQTMKDKIIAIDELLELIKNIQDELKQNILLMKAAEIMQVPLDVLKKEYTNKNKVDSNKLQSVIMQKKPLALEHELEQQILATVFYDPSVVTKQDETLLQSISHEPVGTILKKILQHQNNSAGQPVTVEKALTAQELEYAQQILFKVESSNIKLVFNNLMVQFQKKYWKSLISHIKLKLMQAKRANNKKEILDLLDIFEKLKKDLYKNGRL